ncbi:MAG: hypothetical protein J6T87_02575 [Bacteroidales bacterium]|nr:hypothetical protein [Bacteroidales bacterium]
MIRHINALNDTIKYRYHFSQLTDVEYPRYPANNVHYQYGTVSNTDINAVGKVIRQTDASGLQIFSYGKLGELTENIRTFALPYESHTYTFKMHYEYDSWNRIQSMTYPDGEVVHYDYNRGGILKRVTCNKNGVSSEYIRDIRYNKFELKTSVVYGNSTRNVYEYDSLFRLIHLRSYKLHDTLMQDLTYTYDSVDNILQISNSAAMLSNGLGGNYTNIYTYDDLYRLSEALCRGTQVTMSYHANGRIHRKTVKRPDELHGRNSFIVTPFEYLYNSLHSNVVNGIRPYPYTCNPNEYVTIDEKAYNFLWDSCGNMTAHSKLYSDFARTMIWTEDNRLQCVADNSYLSLFLYDAGGERTYKLTGNYRLQNTNGSWFEYYTLENPTLYASPYLVATRHGYTKHYYAEGERIASKIGGGGISNIGHALICSGNTGAWDEALRQLNVSRFLPNSFLDLLSGLYDWRDSLRQENDVYFYHPDHLGSSSWITDANGEAVQHLEYLPWGEDLIDQKLSGFDGVRYTFSAKEKDSETGLSYFGSRYYCSDLSVWLSVDPMSDKYPSLSPYTYCANNPVRLVDPDGEDYVVVVDDQSKTITIKATYYVTKDTKEGMEMGFQYFASQEQNLSYTMENGESYSIKFDLSIAGEYDTWNEAYDAWSSSGNKYSNFCMSGSTLLADNDIPAIAQTNSGNKITIRSDCSLLYRAYAHEIGHTLGFGEWSSELMRSDGFPQDIGLTNGYVQQSMIRTNHNATPDNISSPYGVTKTTRWDDVGKGYIITK